ncbi:SusC/RagA family TonB-linked outer membrane protein [Flammeovirga kamogawensis]|uniref:SusC/RagA family TonB-linked outer membrane protein n=1 Tax=Flammeovirga kamogawensis TaxID=373891 RepID=A0ABX8GYT7_9BACT|nr:SusC/RagA family TonB-linked outer membrane protein [Flammeovirga kamogawensis]MBB6460929.1 TonB-linked SusC/RagA family outer membrane protein [Flammeovirga kamogawensis]QWG08272.1 SusC/RagA family TonB-linked outer membrane protein [Flammeovirga kamogawensis]TRX70074.1 SusC/RagA family TonB-linked outer membrane protein [Flammeovirga kamogawensis]
MYKFLRAIVSILIVLSTTCTVYAQEQTINGVIKDSMTDEPLIGASVKIKGTTLGTITDFDGKFKLAASPTAELQISYIGYETLEINVNNRSSIEIKLASDATEMQELVVVGLGVERDERSLGYAVQEVSGDDLGAVTGSSNVMNNLSGKVAGVQINQVGGSPGSSSNVVIRGNAMLDGSNQPLYVIDGIPMNNSNIANANDADNGGVDTGDGMSGVNAEDIESMSVLKGPAATAIYGSRGINGVIMITTKSGKGGQKGLGVDFSHTSTVSTLGITPDNQETYAHGTNGNFASDPQRDYGMWGPKVTPGMTTDAYYDGKERTVQFYDNYDEFFKPSYTATTNVSLTKVTDESSVRFSYSNMSNNGNVDNQSYERNTFTLRGTSDLSDKLHLDARMNYIKEDALNRPSMGNSVNNYMGYMNSIPNTYDVNWMKDYKDEDGRPVGYNTINENPYWTMYETSFEDSKDRFMGMASLTYDFTDHLKLQGRAGTDYTSWRAEVLDPLYTPWYESGRAYERTQLDREDNFDGLLTYSNRFGKWDVVGNFGASYMHIERKYTDTGSSNFSDPLQQNPMSGSDRFATYDTYQKAIGSVYATASIGYDGYLFLDVSGRNDWSSTLPLDNNSYFYPSISGSWVFSDMDWDTPEWLTFGKMRASWAKVGSDTDPYMLQQYYQIDGQSQDGLQTGNIYGNTINNSALKPSMQTSYEIGMNLRMFDDKLNLDMAYYNSSSVDQIMKVRIPESSGYEDAIINAGEIINKGVEISLGYDILRKKDLNWHTQVNFAYNYNEVVSLSEGVDQYLVGEGPVNIVAAPGQSYGTIMGSAYKRDSNGNIIVNEDGIPQVEDGYQQIGNGVQPFMVGWVNQFQYKNITFGMVIDAKFGGDIYSSTNANMYSNGKHQDTADGRNTMHETGVYNPGNLVYENGEPFNGFTNDQDLQNYYQATAGVDEEHVYDASYIRISEISIGYTFPKTMVSKAKMQNLQLSFVASNLGYLWKSTENIDPAASFSYGNAQGMEVGSYPLPRTFGLKLNAKF